MGKNAESVEGEIERRVLLTRQQIIESDDIPTEDVLVPEWGGVVCVKGLSGESRDAFESSMIKQRGDSMETNTRNMRARLVALSIVGEDGTLVFSTADVDALGLKSSKALDRVFAVSQRLSGLSKKDSDALAGNSEATPSDSGFTS